MSDTEQRGMRAGYIPLSFRLITKLRSLYLPTILGGTIPPDQQAIVTDISHYEGNVNFTVMQNAGASATVAKCTQGVSIIDSKYFDYVTQCRNIPLGDYHFMENSNGTAQAEWYVARLLASVIPFTHWCDVERAMLSSYIYQWAVKTKTLLGLPNYSLMGIYTSAYMWSLVIDDGYKDWCTRNLMLWVAHYGVTNPMLPTGWTSYVMHQYTPSGDGHKYGCDALEVDLSRCYKSWIDQFNPNSLEKRVAKIETYARSIGWPV